MRKKQQQSGGVIIIAVMAFVGFCGFSDFCLHHAPQDYSREEISQVDQIIEQAQEPLPVILTKPTLKETQLAALYLDDGGAINQRIAAREEKAAHKVRGH